MAHGPLMLCQSMAPRSWLQAATLRTDRRPQGVAVSWAAGSCHAMRAPVENWFYWFISPLHLCHCCVFLWTIFRNQLWQGLGLFLPHSMWWTKRIWSHPDLHSLKTQWNSRRKSSCKKIREKQNINHYLLFFEKQQQQQQQQQQQRQQQQQQNTTTTTNNNTNNNICNISNIFNIFNICNICNIRTKKGQPWSWVNIGPFKHKGAS